jgi:hypothetical protein
MGLAHYIAEGFQAVVAAVEPAQGLEGAALLPGGLYYGARGEIDTPIYPLGRLEITETDRELNSGGGSLATYEIRLTVYSQPGDAYPAEITRRLQAYLAQNHLPWEAIPDALGRIVSIVPQSGTMDEDTDTEFGQDTERSSVTWQFTLSERA